MKRTVVVNGVEERYVGFSKVINSYDDEQVFRPTVHALEVDWHSSTNKSAKLKWLKLFDLHKKHQTIS